MVGLTAVSLLVRILLYRVSLCGGFTVMLFALSLSTPRKWTAEKCTIHWLHHVLPKVCYWILDNHLQCQEYD
jgi:hypothetical protein